MAEVFLYIFFSYQVEKEDKTHSTGHSYSTNVTDLISRVKSMTLNIEKPGYSLPCFFYNPNIIQVSNHL